MIARFLDYLLQGTDVGQFLDLSNPHTVEKIAIAQNRVNADLWCRVERHSRRMWATERRDRQTAAAVTSDWKRPARVIAWQRKA